MTTRDDGSETLDWDATLSGQVVRLRDNPGRQGTTTGRTKQAGSYLLTEVVYGPNERQFVRAALLEVVSGDQEDLYDLLGEGRFGGPADLRRVLTMEKVRGELTNVFYSMEASNTTFYPHQFKPVLKFIESPVGRLLIADEVGLGKTIESLLVWKELQARQDARRLLVVCPAVLREKWRGDLQRRFNIDATVVSTGDLLEKVEGYAERQTPHTFALITSLEGMRPPADYDSDENTKPRARLARLLDQHLATEGFALFDLVVIDEAHYLRNVGTANNRLGHLLRDAARHLLLLTATPIQIESGNLYQLLRMIDPDQFYNEWLFQRILESNAPVVRALQRLWRTPPDVAGAQEAIDTALADDYFRDDPILLRIQEQLSEAVNDDTALRVELGRLLESRSLLSQYMTRNRKRDVLEHRVERGIQVLDVAFTPLEKQVYDTVTLNVRRRAWQSDGIATFALIARQRQMASCMVGALESWEEKGFLDELLWDDFGPSLRSESALSGTDGVEISRLEDLLLSGSGEALEIDRAELERTDSKFKALRDFLLQALEANPREKVIVFSFFRGTLNYLDRRLRAEGIHTALIMGGMGDAKGDVLQAFEQRDGPSVLLSSEVGSEGIDLQFCRVVVNYDLPWNPMKVEQRIGRIDRLGQEAERITIVNLKLVDTIEDRILIRLYNRIELFRESIGDLEEILGQETERLMLELINPTLTDEERDRRARETERAILNRREEQTRLEDEAVNLAAFADYILDTIRDGREKRRWLGAEELLCFVEDFFSQQFPGTKIERKKDIPLSVNIRLSEQARSKLRQFVSVRRPGTPTRLGRHASPVTCIFDPRRAGNFDHSVELIDPTHPLIQWIREKYEEDGHPLHPVSATRLASKEANIEPGTYVFFVQRWTFRGLRKETVLASRALRLGTGEVLNAAASEELVELASRIGDPIPNAANVISDFDAAIEAGSTCEDILDESFGERMADFQADNEVRCNQQETSAVRFAERRIQELRGRLERYREEGKTKPITPTEGLLRKAEEEKREKLERIAARRHTDPSLVQLAAGVIEVVEG